MCVIGMLVSSMTVCGMCSSPFFLVCWVLYQSIFLVGQTFLSFQWDIFLLEVGGLVLLFAPLTSYSSRRGPTQLSALCLHFCLFKIMLMSGVVKVQARCPTWMGLTALHYHYASQCIPTPLSWLAHQLPNFIQKLSVVGTFIIEIPAAFLILLPFRQARVWAAWLNVFLMVCIMLTGNYTFFNLLTATVCLSLLDDASFSWRWKKRTRRDKRPSRTPSKGLQNTTSVLHSEQVKL